MAADLNTLWTAYLVALKAANATKVDTTTLVAKDLPTIRAAAATHTRRDANTMYFDVLIP